MKIRNKRNGTNILAYKSGALVAKQTIPSGAVVDLHDLTDFNQIVNKADFNRGWFEVIVEEKNIETKSQLNSLDKAKKEAEEYTEESAKDKKTKNNKK